MRFIGNKENLVETIAFSMKKSNVIGNTLFDFFSGTANVGRFFKKKGWTVFSSDILYFSYCLQKAYIENNSIPKFENLLPQLKYRLLDLFASPLDTVIEYLNALPGKEGFVFSNYTPKGTETLQIPRKYFSSENGKKIDAIRTQIEDWRISKVIDENEYFILLAVLIESVPFYANISGVFAAFQKKWDPRATKPFYLRKIELCKGTHKNKAYNKDSISLLSTVSADVFYIDPPYNERQYAPNYHVLETIAKYDNPILRGITGMRDYTKQKSDFCNKEKAGKCLEKILNEAQCSTIVLSYNSEGLLHKDEILSKMSGVGNVDFYNISYPRFRSNLNTKKGNINEYIFILKK